jgi:hypothetical protein
MRCNEIYIDLMVKNKCMHDAIMRELFICVYYRKRFLFLTLLRKGSVLIFQNSVFQNSAAVIKTLEKVLNLM